MYGVVYDHIHSGKDEQAVVESKDEITKVAGLLGLDEEEFTDTLLKPKIKVIIILHLSAVTIFELRIRRTKEKKFIRSLSPLFFYLRGWR